MSLNLISVEIIVKTLTLIKGVEEKLNFFNF